MDRARWANDTHTLIIVDLSLNPGQQTVTLEERLNPLYEAAALAQTVDYPVDVILDLREARVLPQGNWLTAIRGLNETAPTNVRRTIVVGSRYTRLLQKVLAAIGSFQHLRIHAVFVQTMEEAYELLELSE